MKRLVVWSGLITTLLIAASAAPSMATFSAVDAKCRQAIAKGAKKYAETINKEKLKCFKSYMKGSFPNTTQCHTEPITGLKVIKAKQKFHKGVGKACDNAVGHASPQENGYVVCAEGNGSCQAIAIDAQYAEADPNNIPMQSNTVVGCISCLLEDHNYNAFVAAYGATPPHNTLRDNANCLNMTGSSMAKYFASLTKMQYPCQLNEDLNAPGNDCKNISPAATIDPKAKAAKALQKMKDKIGAKCSDAILAGLPTCGNTVVSQKNCIEAAVDTYADSVFADVFESPEVIFVSSAVGSPSGDGTILNPINSINAGMTLAIMQSKKELYIDGVAPYAESLTLQSGLKLSGGFNSSNAWVRDLTPTLVLSPTATGAVGTSVSNTTVERLSISASGTTATGASSYGVRLVNPSGVIFRDSSVSSSGAGNGSAGSNGATGASGSSGGTGANGCENSTTTCGSCGQPGGGSGHGGVSCGVPNSGGGGNGGRGGACDTGCCGQPADDGQNGLGSAGGSKGLKGGSGGCGSVPTAGGNAGSVANGANGAAGANFGSAGTTYTPANGAGGGSGTPGSGGGGGGGGGDAVCDTFGGAGGGGGSGGCGGATGTAGTGAGGSFGFWVSGGNAQIINTTITTGLGGTGGAGGSGGAGGGGGIGGNGGSGVDGSVPGQNGGAGGNGGNGGHGGGGGGGPTIGIVCNGSSVVRSGNTITTGTAGGGGVSPGNPGSAGQKLDEKNC